MKAEINKDGQIVFVPQTELEQYAINKFLEELKHGCYYKNRHEDAIARKFVVLEI